MALFQPNPQKILSYENRIIVQPYSANRSALDTTNREMTLSDFPANGLFITYSELKAFTLNEWVLMYKSKNALLELYIMNRGDSGNDYAWEMKIVCNGTVTGDYTKTAPKSLINAHLDKYVGFVIFEEQNKIYCSYIISDFGTPIYYSSSCNTGSYTVAQLLNGSAVPDDPYAFSPESGEDGGYGDFDYSSDDTDFSRLPTLSACDVGFCKLYKMSASEVKSLATYLWGLGSITSFLPIFSDPMECILSLGIVPVTPTTGSSEMITVGNLTTTVSGTKITKQFDTLDCGSIVLNGQQFSKSFMDYSPYTKAELFLPYIGTVALDIDEIMDASALHLQYQFDLLSGACIAELKVEKNYNYQNANHMHKNVLYRYSGNIISNIPITGANYTQMYQAIVSAVATGIGGAAGAETAKTAAGAEAIEGKAALSNVASASSMKAGIKRAGNATANCGYLGGQIPELILSLPKLAHLGEAQGKEVGFPRYGEYTLSAVSGYTKIMQVHLKNIKCTDTERDLIQQTLNAGVIVSNTATPTQTQTAGTVKVYSYSCEKIALNKADNWQLIDTITGTWRAESVDVLKPVISIEATTSLTLAKILKEANYVYIADFNRYYYITEIKAEAGNIVTLTLSVDACMSWLNEVKAEKVVVDRQEKSWNTYLSDGYIKTYNTPYTVVKKFPSGFVSENFILAVAGG